MFHRPYTSITIHQLGGKQRLTNRFNPGHNFWGIWQILADKVSPFVDWGWVNLNGNWKPAVQTNPRTLEGFS
jgi:hypothetical protein